MDEKKIARINELYKKSKTPAGLTSAEKEEQKNLREPDGSITRLEDIDPTKKV